MTAATITSRIQTADPSHEVVVLTASDAETYVSSFSAIAAVTVGGNTDSATPVKATFSESTVTIQGAAAGLKDEVVTLDIWGHKK